MSSIRIAYSPFNLRFLVFLLTCFFFLCIWHELGMEGEWWGLAMVLCTHFMKPNIAKAIWLLTTFRFGRNRSRSQKKKKNRSISGAIVGLSGLVGIRPHRLVLLGLLSSLSHTPHSPIPIPIAASLTSRDVDVNKLSERLTSIWFAKDDCDTLYEVRAYWQRGIFNYCRELQFLFILFINKSRLSW